MSVLDLSNEMGIPKQFAFSFEYPKQTLTGTGFLSYEGLRAYLITGSKYPIYLQGNLEYANQNFKPDYIYLADLRERLADTLRTELAKYPFLKLKYGPKTEVVWTQFGITPAQQEWVEVVRSVLSSKF